MLTEVEHYYPPSTLVRTSNGELQIELDPPPARSIPWVSAADIPRNTTPVRITISQGETLFLPAGWWHRVEQNEGSGGLAVALN
jgi:jumonji domain-containing protein 7